MIRSARRALVLALCMAAPFTFTLVSVAVARNAYVVHSFPAGVSVLDGATNSEVGTRIPPGGVNPYALAITPDGRNVYAPNRPNGSGGSVSVIDTSANATVGTPIGVGENPFAIAITPDGTRAYVVNSGSDTVSVIDIATNAVVATIPVGSGPGAIAITPDGTRAYVANSAVDNISVIDTATNTVVDAPIPVGNDPEAMIAITPDGSTAYVPNFNNVNPSTVSVIDLATNTPVGAGIPVGSGPFAVAITPDGARAYVVHEGSDDVYVIDTATNTTVGPPIPVGMDPDNLAVTPDGSRVYVANSNSNDISVIDTATNLVVGAPISSPGKPLGIAFVPNQPPVAAFAAARAGGGASAAGLGPAGLAVSFDAGASRDSDGTLARYDWDFGDGTTQTLFAGAPTTSHTYSAPGTYTATLTVTDHEGCSNRLVFTGQTAYCNGSSVARTQVEVDVDPPGLKLSGTKRQKADASIEVGVRCDEPCALVAKGKLAAGGRSFNVKANKQLEAGKKGTLKLKLSNAARDAAAEALRAGGSLQARITVRATDAAGNATTAKRRVSLE